MRTGFSPGQLEDPNIREANDALRNCVHCGFCLPACPTYALSGDERDSPRGRIYLIKEMLEDAAPPSHLVVRHLDGCLSCLACQVACPSGVDYRHLIDRARIHIEAVHRRRWPDRPIRRWLGLTLPYRRRFGWLMALARLARPARKLFGRRLGNMLSLLPTRRPGIADAPSRPARPPGFRVALLPGCVQAELRPEITAATVRLLMRAIDGGPCPRSN